MFTIHLINIAINHIFNNFSIKRIGYFMSVNYSIKNRDFNTIEIYSKLIDLFQENVIRFIFLVVLYFIFKKFENILGNKVDELQSNDKTRGKFEHYKAWFIYLSAMFLRWTIFSITFVQILFILQIISKIFLLGRVFP